jgi:predicted ABC-type ATPase
MIGILICGPSGVGKTSNLSKIFDKVGAHPSILDPDKRTEKEHQERSSKTLEEVHEYISEKKSFAYVATCGGITIIKDLLKKMKDMGYRTVMVILYTSVETAIERISKREQHTPEEVILDLHSFFTKKAEYYMKARNVDELLLYNNETKFSLLLDKKDKKIHCYKKTEKFFFDISPYCRNSRI